jgi:hypothetical protein
LSIAFPDNAPAFVPPNLSQLDKTLSVFYPEQAVLGAVESGPLRTASR